ncbi:hypothetical protein [Cellulomonas sp. HZM]|uniref:hypothetical protein n=1 Tax=Cellulomonas sp. HZM TaxID=1454010 RepID=UPI0004938820|nr:hypothetical protein [Cellulomonas sp. HZM]
MNWLEVVGWIGSLLVIVSLMQARVLRFRWLNLAGAAIATVYNAVIGVWPFAVMNGVITIIDIYWLAKLLRERHDDGAYEVVEVAPDDAYLAHLMRVHADDIARFRTVPGAAADAAFLVARGDEAVGVVLVRDEGEGVGRVDLDWVTPRFRDFTPGEFVYRRSGVFADKGYRELVHADVPGSREYLGRVGFTQAGAEWVRPVAA